MTGRRRGRDRETERVKRGGRRRGELAAGLYDGVADAGDAGDAAEGARKGWLSHVLRSHA